MPLPPLEKGIFRVSVQYEPEDPRIPGKLMEADLSEYAVEKILDQFDDPMDEECDAIAPMLAAIVSIVQMQQIDLEAQEEAAESMDDTIDKLLGPGD